jgi:hypothetical protein
VVCDPYLAYTIDLNFQWAANTYGKAPASVEIDEGIGETSILYS